MRVVVRSAVWSRVVLLAIAFVAGLAPDYDTSRETVSLAAPSAADAVVERVFGAFSSWDGEHFAHIAESGYADERQRAFFPLYPLAVRALSHVLAPVSAVLQLAPRSRILVAGALLSNGCFVLAATLLFALTRALLGDDALAAAAAALFCVSPASIFFSALYTESLFAALCFAGMLALTRRRRWAATACFALATATRSNGLLCCGFLAFEAVSRFVPLAQWLLLAERPLPPLRGAWRRWQWWAAAAAEALLLAVRCAIVVAPYAAVQLHGAALYCKNPLPKWCTTRPLPNFYGHVQEQYWNQGAFRYWSLKQLPNWLLALPALAIAFLACASYWRWNRRGCSSSSSSESGIAFCKHAAMPYVVHMAALAVFAVIFMHVQVATRMLASSCPAFYWWPATLLLRQQQVEDKSSRSSCLSAGRLCLVYFVVYFALGTTLFVNFLPWT